MDMFVKISYLHLPYIALELRTQQQILWR